MKINQAGDTIVEVLISLVIIGSVLGYAYTLTNTSLSTTRDSQYRSTALQIGQSQIESLKTQVLNNPSFLSGVNSSQTFCLNNGVITIIVSLSTCEFDSSDTLDSTGPPPLFNVSISSTSTNISTDPWDQVELQVTWPGTNGGQNNLNLFYGFDNND